MENQESMFVFSAFSASFLVIPLNGFFSASANKIVRMKKKSRANKSFLITSGSMPPTASRNRLTAYVNGTNGLIFWKNSGVRLTGKVPPELENWRTRKIMASPFPMFPKTETSVYVIVTNIMLVMTAKTTN